jgi:predicted P-loop ATPase
MVPGIKVDHVLILEGEQGTYKSTALRALFDPWFSDDPAEIGTKDASIQLSGIWCLEYADLDRFGRADRNRLKAFITRQSDRYRAPFGRYAADYPRQLVFAATTNESSFLDDPTGGRRFWPLRSTRPDPNGLTKIRGQLWAEAVHRYAAGEKFYLSEPDLQAAAVAQQRYHQHEEAWGERIKYVLNGKDEFYALQKVTVPTILGELGLPMDRWTTANYNRIRDYLQFIGWMREESDASNHTFLRPQA